MKRLLLPLLAALALPTAVEANWSRFFKYQSEKEAVEACKKWQLDGGVKDKSYRFKRSCLTEYSTRQILGLDRNKEIEKRFRF